MSAEEQKTFTAGVIIDGWKRAIFEERLNKAGYEFTRHPGITADTITLKVKTNDVEALAVLIAEAQVECEKVASK